MKNTKPLTETEKAALFAALAADAERNAALVTEWSAARDNAADTKTEADQAEADFQWDRLCGRHPNG